MTINVVEEVRGSESMAYFDASIITSKSWLCTLNCSQPSPDPSVLQPLSDTMISSLCVCYGQWFSFSALLGLWNLDHYQSNSLMGQSVMNSGSCCWMAFTSSRNVLLGSQCEAMVLSWHGPLPSNCSWVSRVVLERFIHLGTQAEISVG